MIASYGSVVYKVWNTNNNDSSRVIGIRSTMSIRMRAPCALTAPDVTQCAALRAGLSSCASVFVPANSSARDAATHLRNGRPHCTEARMGRQPRQLHQVNETVALIGQASPVVILDIRRPGIDSHFRPKSSLIMVVHNAAVALEQSLPRIFDHTIGCAEMLLLLDQCTDESLTVIIRHLTLRFDSSHIVRVRVVEQSTPIWEAAGENLLMSISDPHEAYVLVQPDNLVSHHGWDIQLSRPLRAHQDVVGVSGFLAHAFGAATPTQRHLRGRPFIRDPGYSEAKANIVESINAFYVRDTGSRGPLLLHAARAQRLGFFDHELFWLEDSDHDLFCRARVQHGWAVGTVLLKTVPPQHLLHLKTKTHGEKAASREARNESSATLRNIRDRAAAAHKLGRKGCIQDPAWIESMLRTPPRIELRPLPLMEGMTFECAGHSRGRGNGSLPISMREGQLQLS